MGTLVSVKPLGTINSIHCTILISSQGDIKMNAGTGKKDVVEIERNLCEAIDVSDLRLC